MQFSQPWAFWLLLLLPMAVAALLANERFVRHVQTRFRLPSAAVQGWRSVLRPLTGVLALLALIMALSGPQIWATLAIPSEYHLKLAVGIDVSKSMLAEDMLQQFPEADRSTVANRLTSASRLALNLFEQLDGQQAGLFFFARNGIEVVSPTRDQGFLRYMVQNTRLAELTESGSDLKMAMTTGATLLGDPDSQAGGAIILLTDGEDTENTLAEIIVQAEQMRLLDLSVHTVGIGLSEEVYIPIRRPGGAGIEGFYTDTTGEHLRTRLQSGILQSLASRSGGHYFELARYNPENLAQELLAQIPRASASGGSRERGLKNLAPLFLLIGVVLYSTHSLL